MAIGRTLHVRCATWEQVEVFHTRKLRRGKLLSMKVPFHSERGTAVTLNLELPNRTVIPIEGTVLKSSPVQPDPKSASAKADAGKTWLEVELIGFTQEVVAQIRRMAAGLAPEPEAAPAPASAPLPPPAAQAVPPLPPPAAQAVPPLPPPAAQAVPPLPPPAAQAVPPLPPPVAQAVPPLPPPVAQAVPPPRAAQAVPPQPPQGATGALPDPSAPSGDELAVFQHLTAELRRLRSAAVHEVLGVPYDAGAEAIRRGWMDLMQRYHPDLVAQRNALAITHLAEELTILANRAYDRLRVALVAEGRATSVGPSLSPPPGWLVGFDDIPSDRPSGVPSGRSSGRTNGRSNGRSSPRAKRTRTPQNGGNVPSIEPVAPPPPQAEGGEAFELRARAMLGEGDPDNAQEVLAAALCVYPRSRPLRSLYYVASAISALAKGEVMLATSHLETALAHHEHCSEAAAILELLQRPNTPVTADEMTRLFR